MSNVKICPCFVGNCLLFTKTQTVIKQFPLWDEIFTLYIAHSAFSQVSISNNFQVQYLKLNEIHFSIAAVSFHHTRFSDQYRGPEAWAGQSSTSSHISLHNHYTLDILTNLSMWKLIHSSLLLVGSLLPMALSHSFQTCLADCYFSAFPRSRVFSGDFACFNPLLTILKT